MAKRKRLERGWTKTLTRTTSDVENVKLNMLLWGPPKVGKTEFAKSCPNVYMIAAENGVLTLKDHDIPYFPLFTDEYAIYDTVMQIGKAIKDGEIVCDTVYLDSEWKLSILLIKEILEETGLAAMRTQDWGTLGARMEAINSMFLQMDKHFIATCGEAIKTSREDEEQKEATFNLSGGYRDQMPYEFDQNIYMSKKLVGRKMKYYGHTQDKNKRSAAGRIALPPEIENPTFTFIWDTIQKELKKKVEASTDV